jgi:hypothetical protein
MRRFILTLVALVRSRLHNTKFDEFDLVNIQWTDPVCAYDRMSVYAVEKTKSTLQAGPSASKNLTNFALQLATISNSTSWVSATSIRPALAETFGMSFGCRCMLWLKSSRSQPILTAIERDLNRNGGTITCLS